MKYLKYYELEEGYHKEKDTYEYPTVSYTQDTDKVWYMENTPSVKNIAKMVFSITEDDVNNYGGDMMEAWGSLSMFDSVTVDGVEQANVSEYDVNVEVQDGDEFKLTDESFIPRTIASLTINFNEPLNQDGNIAFAFHEKWGEDGEWVIDGWLETLDDIKEYYNPSIMTTQDGRISSITMDLGWEFDESYQLGISVHTYADDEDPYELIPSKDNVIDINIKYTSRNSSLYLPTTEVRDYEVVATIYNDVANMNSMFYECISLTSLDLSNFDTSNATDMGYMFYNCSGLTSLDLSNFDTSNVIYMSEMFGHCYSLTSLDVSSFDTSKVTIMDYMFNGCIGLTSLDVSNFDTSNVTDMSSMFNGCNGLTSLDLSNFNTSKVTSMISMFSNCSGLTSLNLSSFNTSKVTSMGGMFGSCSRLTSITFGSQADVSKVTSYNSMFSGIITTGTFTYPKAYESAWNTILVTKQSTSKFPSTWTATAVDYENGALE